MYVYMYVYVCVYEDWMQKSEEDAKLFQIQEISHQKNPVIEVSRKSINMELRYSTKCAVFKLA